jgi:hypothetical protein
MEITIPLERTFHCPEGTFKAVFKGARTQRRFKDERFEENIRLTFEVEVPSIRNKIVTVARNFPPSMAQGTQLRSMLESWLGREFFQENAGKKINLDDHIDKEAEIVVEHCRNEHFSNPYCNLAGIFPPGTMPLREYEGE